MKKTLLTAICLFIYTFFEILAVFLDVMFLMASFTVPTFVGFLLKPWAGDVIAVIGVVIGVALFGVTFVNRKCVQAYLQTKLRAKSESMIESVRTKPYFLD
ncbi:MAG: hypothetical protein E6Q68_01080 [Polynucleobacter sp.]|nr:MAG: hypothetical protein E6Q68_01080 [Polynucleobacter sp.]